MKWCVVIPTYNNENTLENVIREVLQVTADIIVVNDGSTDRTPQILQKFQTITVISHTLNKGKGYALQKGFKAAYRNGFTHAITLDSDGQHYAGDIAAFVASIEENPDCLVVGSRTLPEEKLTRGSGFANRFSNFWFRLISGIKLPDTQSGFRLYPIHLLHAMRFFTTKYEFELEILVRSAWKGICVTSLPIRVYYPPPGERISHYRPVKDFIRISLLNTVMVLVALLYIKPFSFLKYLKKESVAGFLKKHVLQTDDSVAKTTLSVMFGVFMGIVPIWGYQLITAITLAYLFRLNKFIVIVAANISIPPMIPFILYLSFLTGGWLMKSNLEVDFTTDISFGYFRDNLFQYVLGSVVFAMAAAICFGMLTYLFLKVFRRRKALTH